MRGLCVNLSAGQPWIGLLWQQRDLNHCWTTWGIFDEYLSISTFTIQAVQNTLELMANKMPQTKTAFFIYPCDKDHQHVETYLKCWWAPVDMMFPLQSQNSLRQGPIWERERGAWGRGQGVKAFHARVSYHWGRMHPCGTTTDINTGMFLFETVQVIKAQPVSPALHAPNWPGLGPFWPTQPKRCPLPHHAMLPSPHQLEACLLMINKQAE